MYTINSWVLFMFDTLTPVLGWLAPIIGVALGIGVAVSLDIWVCNIIATGAVRWGRHRGNILRRGFMQFNKQDLIDITMACGVLHHMSIVLLCEMWEPTPVVGILFWGWMCVSLCSQFYMATWAYKRNPTHPLFN